MSTQLSVMGAFFNYFLSCRAVLLGAIFLGAAGNLHAQQTILYADGQNNGSAIVLTGATSPTTLDLPGRVAEQSGSISESGGSFGIIKTGAGLLFLTGFNSYSGGTTLTEGLLVISHPGAGLALGMGPLTINGGQFGLNVYAVQVGNFSGSGGGLDTGGGGSLTINQNANTTFSGTISGLSPYISAALILNGTNSSSLQLTGNNTYLGNTLINGGTLIAGNASAFGIGDMLVSGGTLTTGNGNHLINVTNNYVQGPAGTLRININGTGQGTTYDLLNVGGTAALDGALQLYLQNYAPGAGHHFTFITAAGGITGSFTSIVSNLPSLKVTPEGPGSFFLSQGSFFSFAQTPNQRSVAANLDLFSQSFTSGPTSNLIAALNNVSLDPAALASAFDQLTPLKFGSFASSTAFNNVGFSFQQLDSYLSRHRGANGTFVSGNGGLDYSGLAFNNPNMDPSLQAVRSRLLAWSPSPSTGLLSDSGSLFSGMELKDAGVKAESPDLWNVFVNGNVILAQDFSNPSVGQSGAHSTTGAVQVGADYKITPHWLVGTTFAYGRTHATLDTIGSNATVNTYSPGVYTSYTQNGWFANALGSYGFAGYSQNRNVAISGFNGTATSSPGGDQIVGNLDGGYEFHRGNWTLGPTLGLGYTHLDVDGYTETGLPGANLTVASQQADSLRSRFGGSVSYALKSGDLCLTPHLSASWQHEFLNQSRGITSQFSGVGAGSFVVNTSNPSQNSALADVGLDAQVNNALTLFVDYSAQAGQSNYFGQSIQGGMKIGF